MYDGVITGVLSFIAAVVAFILSIYVLVWLYRCQDGINETNKLLRKMLEKMPELPVERLPEITEPVIQTSFAAVNELGDWDCPKCWKRNEAFRKQCYSCKTAKPELGPFKG